MADAGVKSQTPDFPQSHALLQVLSRKRQALVLLVLVILLILKTWAKSLIALDWVLGKTLLVCFCHELRVDKLWALWVLKSTPLPKQSPFPEIFLPGTPFSISMICHMQKAEPLLISSLHWGHLPQIPAVCVIVPFHTHHFPGIWVGLGTEPRAFHMHGVGPNGKRKRPLLDYWGLRLSLNSVLSCLFTFPLSNILIRFLLLGQTTQYTS